MPEPGKTPYKFLQAIHAARRARGLDEETFRSAVENATNGRTRSTKRLTVEEAHSLLDTLNGKDAAREAERRHRFTGRKRAAPSRRRAPADNGKIVRFASEAQVQLMLTLAFRVGLTKESSPGAHQIANDRVTRWMTRKFGAAWKPATTIGYALEGRLAQKMISALRSWEANRRRKWREAYGEPAANVVLGRGFPIAWDDFTRRDPLPPLPRDVAMWIDEQVPAQEGQAEEEQHDA